MGSTAVPHEFSLGHSQWVHNRVCSPLNYPYFPPPITHPLFLALRMVPLQSSQRCQCHPPLENNHNGTIYPPPASIWWNRLSLPPNLGKSPENRHPPMQERCHPHMHTPSPPYDQWFSSETQAPHHHPSLSKWLGPSPTPCQLPNSTVYLLSELNLTRLFLFSHQRIVSSAANPFPRPTYPPHFPFCGLFHRRTNSPLGSCAKEAPRWRRSEGGGGAACTISAWGKYCKHC